ncbi:hypothetical protein EI94DRAFT_1790080 [Lactarius quietus]|nr:hypothetical protein EI94DRAFT_1790080 [Lactarius quietus]
MRTCLTHCARYSAGSSGGAFPADAVYGGENWLDERSNSKRTDWLAGAQTKAAAVTVPGSGEPFMVTLRRTGDGEVKFIWWFATVRTGEEKMDGTQMEVESSVSAFFDVDAALEKATFRADGDVIAKAAELVRATYPEAVEDPTWTIASVVKSSIREIMPPSRGHDLDNAARLAQGLL